MLKHNALIPLVLFSILFVFINPSSHAQVHSKKIKYTYHPPKPKDKNTQWKTTSKYLNPIMNWETDNQKHPLVASTYGPQHNIVYYHIDPTLVSSKVIQAAFSAWNDLNVLNFQATDNSNVNAIQVTQRPDTNLNQDENTNAITYFNTATNANQNPVVLTDVNINLSAHFNQLGYQTKLNVLEHEIGHALGFAHDTSKVFNPNHSHDYGYASSVMATAETDSAYEYQEYVIPLGAREANMLKQHYPNAIINQTLH